MLSFVHNLSMWYEENGIKLTNQEAQFKIFYCKNNLNFGHIYLTIDNTLIYLFFDKNMKEGLTLSTGSATNVDSPLTLDCHK